LARRSRAGGFYQALTDGTYERYGLDVKIIQGGPQLNNQLLLAAGRVDFYLGANMIHTLHAVEQGIPTLVVASLFQKDPLILSRIPALGSIVSRICRRRRRLSARTISSPSING
jgi:NitT/TauT family transport system substrate-binding protein